MFTFNFLGKDCYTDFGIVVEKRPVIPKPQRNIQYVEVPGRSGSLKVDDSTYKDIVIPMQCWYRGNDNVAGRAEEIKSWLDGGEGPLILSNQPDRFYIAHVSDEFDISQEIVAFGKFLINFRCKPFKYSIFKEELTITEPQTISNPGTIYSEPVFKIYGSGDITISINSNSFSLSGLTDYINVDSPLMDCYRDTILKNNQMNGDFPVLEPGNNDISWTGNVTKIEITTNWRWL